MNSQIELPPVRVLRNRSAREPGVIFFVVRTRHPVGNTGSWLVRLASSGELSVIRSGAKLQGLRRTGRGTLLVTSEDGTIEEISPTGHSLQHWHVPLATPKTVSVQLETAAFHHGVSVGPDASFFLLQAEAKTFAQWPAPAAQPGTSLHGATVVGDVLLQIRDTGEICDRWSLFDLLDAERITYGSHDDFWHERGFPDSFDWCHANGVFYDSKDDSIIVSLRTQDSIVKINRQSGELRWILGSPANWRHPWAGKLLKPEGPLEWPFHQHDCSITPSGTVLCFDNGNHRAQPPDAPMPAALSRSRAVEYAIDPQARTVRQIWAYPDGTGERIFSGFQGGAIRLPESRNTLVTFGGICSRRGEPSFPSEADHIQARIVEVSPEGEDLLDVRVGHEAFPSHFFVFRSEHLPPGSA